MVRIGIDEGSDGLIYERRNFFGCDQLSQISFSGNCTLAEGVSLKAIDGGILRIGNNVSFNLHNTVLCKKRIIIGNNVMTGWNVLMSDGDGHSLYNKNGELRNNKMPIVIGDNVWLGANSTLLKGSTIYEGAIVGYGSVVNRAFPESNVILAGAPAKIVARDIFWEK